MTQTILILNEKGGVGKTTLATNLASALAADGSKVLLLDGDAQGHSGLSLRVPREDGLARLLIQNAAFDKVLRKVDPTVYGGGDGWLLVLPSAEATSTIGKRIDDKSVNTFTLGERLKELNGYVDYVIIDASPTISELHTAFYFAADVVFCPTQCEFLSIEGLMRSARHLRAAQAAGEARGLKVAQLGGIVPNMFNGKEIVQHQNLGFLRAKFDPDEGDALVLDAIKLRTDWKQAVQKKMSIAQWKPKSEAAKEAQLFVRQVMDRLQAVSHV